jgi:hypothetical protein
MSIDRVIDHIRKALPVERGRTTFFVRVRNGLTTLLTGLLVKVPASRTPFTAVPWTTTHPRWEEERTAGEALSNVRHMP